MFNYIISNTNCTIYLDNTVYTIKKESKHWNKLIQAIKTQNIEQIRKVINLTQTVNAFINHTYLKIKNNTIYYGDTILDESLTRRILQMIDEGFNVNPMIKFLDNLMQNPSNRAVKELYNFLEVCNLPITEDGRFIAFKKIRYDYKDVYSGTQDNTPGMIVKMPRNLVDDNKENTCSHGLHVCSLGYLPNFGGERLVVVLVNPRDVVSIPIDYENSKMRVCEYEVFEEIPMNTLDEFNQKLQAVFSVNKNETESEDETVDDYDVDDYEDDYEDKDI